MNTQQKIHESSCRSSVFYMIFNMFRQMSIFYSFVSRVSFEINLTLVSLAYGVK